jgi:type II secretory pathway pseudopilin PulG
MKKKAFTLMEIIIVIFLITLITGAIGYSMKGTLDKGKAFRTRQGIEQLRDLLLMCLAEGEKGDEILKNPVEKLKQYGLAKNPEELVKDGWGKKFLITMNRGKNDFQIVSESLKQYDAKTGRAREEASVDDD